MLAHPHLPVYQLDAPGGRVVLYAPGRLAVVSAAQSARIQRAWLEGQPPSLASDASIARDLEEAGADASRRWRDRAGAAFAPECLTVYLSNQCQLRCPYCYGTDRQQPHGSQAQTAGTTVDPAVVVAAARLVARTCVERAMPFRFVLHGGGDPMVHPALVELLVSATRQIATEHGLDWFGYMATNGMFGEDAARWVAGHISLTGISCDGPPDIQGRQRPRSDGSNSSEQVERTARVLAEAGGRFAVRTTITRRSMDRQSEIVEYLHEHLGATEMRFEPVYGWSGGRRPEFLEEDAQPFAEAFLAADRTARALGCRLTLSGVRLDELHGPYCNVLRNVLQITPEGLASPCFVHQPATGAAMRPCAIGRLDSSRGEFVLNVDLLDAMRRRAADIPSACAGCINSHHCARGCPEQCDLGLGDSSARPPSSDHPGRILGGFRCLVQRRVAQAWILDAAEDVSAIESTGDVRPDRDR